MEKAVAGYAVRAAAKLRRHALVASAMQVFLQANCFSKIDPQHVNHATFGIEASADPLFEPRANIYLMSGRRRRAAGGQQT